MFRNRENVWVTYDEQKSHLVWSKQSVHKYNPLMYMGALYLSEL